MFFSVSPPGFPPIPDVAFAWGSMSTRRVRFSITAREAARLTAVVVFPTPPFWLATAMTWTKRFLLQRPATPENGKKRTGSFYHAGDWKRKEILPAVPAALLKPGRADPLREEDLPDLSPPHAQRKFEPDGAARGSPLRQPPFLPPGLPLPPGSLHPEKAPLRSEVRLEKGDGFRRRECGPGDDMLEPPDGERISRFHPALHHFRVGKGEHSADVRQERALFRGGLQEDDVRSGKGYRQGDPRIAGHRPEIQDPPGERAKRKEEEGIQDMFPRDFLRGGDRREPDRPVPAQHLPGVGDQFPDGLRRHAKSCPGDQPGEKFRRGSRDVSGRGHSSLLGGDTPPWGGHSSNHTTDNFQECPPATSRSVPRQPPGMSPVPSRAPCFTWNTPPSFPVGGDGGGNGAVSRVTGLRGLPSGFFSAPRGGGPPPPG